MNSRTIKDTQFNNYRSNRECLLKHCMVAILIASLFYFFLNRCFPLHPGRDMGTYWLYYRDLFRVYPDFPLVMLFRTPVTPIFFGVCFDWFGPSGVQIILAVLYVTCLLLIFLIGSSLSIWIGYLSMLLLGANIKYYYWFFSVGSESPQTFLLVFWMAYAFYTFRSANILRWILHASIIFILVMTRPGNQTLILCAIIPLLNLDVPIKRRALLSFGFIGSYIVCHILFSSYNYFRYGDFTIAKMGNAVVPFYRVYAQDRLVRPENGPKSRELADMVERDILTKDTFYTYHIDIETFFEAATPRMFNQLVKTVSDVYGWDHNWKILVQVALEAHRKYPTEFWLGFIDQIRNEFYCRGDGSYDLRPKTSIYKNFEEIKKERYRMYKAEHLPIPSEDDLVPKPKGSDWILAAKPENYPNSKATYFNIKHEALKWTFQNKFRCINIFNVFDMYGIKFPVTCLLIIIGFMGAVISSIQQKKFCNLEITVITIFSIINMLATFMGSVQFGFRYPFDSIFIVFGCFGMYRLALMIQKRYAGKNVSI